MAKGQSKQNNPWITIWTRPRATLRAILENDPTRTVIWIAILFGLVNALRWIATFWEIYPARPHLHHPLFLIALLIIGAIYGIVNLYLGGWLYWLTGSWIGGKGHFTEVKCAVGWSLYPMFVTSLVGLPGLFFDHPLAIKLLSGLLFIILAIYSIILTLKLIGEAHRFSAWKALLAVFIAFVILFVVFMILLLLIPLLHPLFGASDFGDFS